jgi:hypothetical protein
MQLFPSRIRFIPDAEKAELRIHLEFSDRAKRKPIFFDVTFDDAMRLLHALQGFQAKYKIPIPPNLRPSGKPTLVVVPDNKEPSETSS